MARSFSFPLPYLREDGPLCQITLKPSQATVKTLKLGKRKVPSIRVLALIDTGASSTAISQKVINTLKLVPHGTVKIYTSNKIAEIRNEYDISLAFNRDVHLPMLRVFSAHLRHRRIDCLIGRDVLRHGLFIYNGPENQVTLSF